jgi:DNA-binding transcriptional ArsR family regulator
VLTAGELASICSEYAPANVSYHIGALKKAGLLVLHKSGKGYHLPKDAAVRAKPPVRRPNTALLPSAPKPPDTPPAAIPPPAPAAIRAPGHDITLELTCPAGRLKIDGTPKLVFGFLEQLKELAA